MRLRPMDLDDVDACEALWHHSWAALRDAQGLPGAPGTDEDRARLRRRLAHLLATDPGGSWVAEEDGEVVGLAQALVRDDLWVLSLLGVAVHAQSRGVGRALVDRSLGYGDASGPGLILSSPDPRAMHRYVSAGFALHPAVIAMGEPDGERLAAMVSAGPPVRPAGGDELEELAAVSRRLRGASHGPDLSFLLAQGARLLVVDGGSAGPGGFAVFGPTRLVLLAADDEDSARALLAAGLAGGTPGAAVEVGWVTGAQQWAVRACAELGLGLRTMGPVMVRGRPGPLSPYLPSGAFG